MSRGFWAVVQTCDRKDLRDSNVVGSVGFLEVRSRTLGAVGTVSGKVAANSSGRLPRDTLAAAENARKTWEP